MKKEELAYAAGIIDGEGSISIVRIAPKRGRVSPAFDIDISVAMTDDVAVRWLYITFGGCFSTFQPKNLAYRKSYRWHLYGSLPDAFLKKIQPFIKVKAPQVAIALALRRSISETRYKGSHRLNVAIVQDREKLCQEMHALNRKGTRRKSSSQCELS